jgi:hypothetical protein
VAVRFVLDLEPDWGEPLGQFTADRIGDAHYAEVIRVAVFSSGEPSPLRKHR